MTPILRCAEIKLMLGLGPFVKKIFKFTKLSAGLLIDELQGAYRRGLAKLEVSRGFQPGSLGLYDLVKLSSQLTLLAEGLGLCSKAVGHYSSSAEESYILERLITKTAVVTTCLLSCIMKDGRKNNSPIEAFRFEPTPPMITPMLGTSKIRTASDDRCVYTRANLLGGIRH